VTHISATPSFYRLLLPADRAMTGVRSVTLGGESSDTAHAWLSTAALPVGPVSQRLCLHRGGTLLTAEGDVFGITPELDGRVFVQYDTLRVHRSLLGEFGEAAAQSTPVNRDKLMKNGEGKN
jgi:hypothetical protein